MNNKLLILGGLGEWNKLDKDFFFRLHGLGNFYSNSNQECL